MYDASSAAAWMHHIFAFFLKWPGKTVAARAARL
jgi:hypothetical protein